MATKHINRLFNVFFSISVLVAPFSLYGFVDDTDRLIIEKTKIALRNHPDSVLLLLDSCLLKWKAHNEPLYYECMLLKAQWLKTHYRFSEALLHVELCQPYFEKTKNRVKVAECSYISGFCESELGNYPNSIKNLLLAVALYDSLQLKNELYNSYNTLAVDFYLLNKPKLAQTLWNEVYLYAQEVTDTLLISKSLNNLAIVSEMNQQAIDLYLKSIGLSLQIGDSAGASNSIMNLANLYLNQQQFQKAKYMLNEADRLNQSIFNPTQQIYIYLNKAQLYQQLNQPDSAFYYITQCQILSEKIEFYTLMPDVFDMRALIFEQKKNMKEAINNLRLSTQWKDTLWIENLESTAAEFEIKYRTQKQIDEIHIQQAIINKQNSDLKARTYLLVGLFLILISIVFIGIVHLWYSKKIKKNNRDLLIKNEIINQNNKKLKETIFMRDRLMSIIAHDIKNPLATISGFAELITLSDVDQSFEKIQSFGEQILTSSNHLIDLLDNLLQWAKSQQNGIVLKPEPINIYRLIQKNFKLMSSMAQSKNITLLNLCTSDGQIIADKVLINTVVRNLINNAIKFTPANGQIKINDEKSRNFVLIHFEDNGIGIEPMDLPLLFNNQIDRSKIGKNLLNKGIGLGLLLCHDFMTLNGGTISVTSEIKKGTKFTLSFPVPSS